MNPYNIDRMHCFSDDVDRQLQMTKRTYNDGFGKAEWPKQQIFIETERETIPWNPGTQPELKSSIIGSYLCPVCGQKYITKSDLLQHQFKDHKRSSFNCDVCGQRFRKRQSMETHQRIHTGEKPYICRLCRSSFHDMGGLTYHMKECHDRK